MQEIELCYTNLKVLKTENIKEEVTDTDVLSTVKVSPDIEYIEQMSIKCDTSSNEVGGKTIKYETNITEEKITPYDTEMDIKTEINDIKYEFHKEEATDRDILSVVKVSPDIEYREQKIVRSDISSNKVIRKTVKYETNIAEETITPYHTDIDIKTVINDIKSELDIEEHKLSYNHSKSTTTDDYKIERGNQHMEHTVTKCNTIKIHVASKNGDNELYQPFKYKFKTDARKDHVEHCKVQRNKIAKWYQCQYCDFKTKFKGNFVRHHSLKHDGPAELFFCALCDFKTKCKRYLVPHLKSKHVNSSQSEIFHCELCDFKTKCQPYLLRHHKRKHDGPSETLHCEVCHFKTKYKRSLSRHQRLKHDNSLQICHICPYKTNYNNKLAEHLAKKHGENIQCFQCSICANSYMKKDSLVTHLKSKHSANIYECYFCGFCTKYKHSLDGHIRRRHKN